ncbi:MAG: MMPL family transporter [Solirubrobacteraceae bacterium]
MFILARMREEYDRTGSTSQAAVRGIASTGRLVTSAALSLFLSFVAMATGPETDIKIRATGLGAGILRDATIVRALLVPALVSLFGRWNWWLPARPARLLRVTPSLPNRSPSQRLPAGTERIAAVHGASGDLGKTSVRIVPRLPAATPGRMPQGPASGGQAASHG